ncbi:MAG: glycosyltransferase [Bacteroidetes bacterium]|nr:glycosyltransferase [Fibrella sp.]
MVSIQLIYIVFVFSRTAFHRLTLPDAASSVPSEGVTIVVCAHNEFDNLTQLVPLLAQQQHPLFEVLIMDDRSTDETKNWLPGLETAYPNVHSIRIDKDYAHISPKKYALTIALKKAIFPTVLLTDADCRPASDGWLAGMEASLTQSGKAIVLGVSLYEKRAGFLNFLIQAETLFTAVQYLSLALAGRPYMGVGRNLMYRRQTFFDNKGFYTHKHVLGGDDDLFINEVATPTNTAVSLDPATFTTSIPKETWPDWRHQKRRHLSVGHQYKTGHKIRLGLLMGSQVLTWLLGLIAGGYVLYAALFGPAQLLNPLVLIATALFILRWLLFWLVVARISNRLGTTVRWYAIPFMDVVLASYYAIMGVTTLLTRRRKIYWR